MKELIIRQATVVDKNSKHNGKRCDILLKSGKIAEIANKIAGSPKTAVIEGSDLFVSPGWVDMQAHFADPGNEERETLETGLKQAAMGGFTAIAPSPLTQPVIQSKSDVGYLKKQSSGFLTEILPVVTVTKNANGESLNELFDAFNAGAVAFSDYKSPVSNSLLFKLALQYTQSFNGLLYSFPSDNDLVNGAMITESADTAHLGLKGQANLAEYMGVHRDVALRNYVGGRVHFNSISTAASVDYLSKNKSENISSAVALHNLCYTDKALEGLNSVYKVNPPLRSDADRKALIKGLKSGVIQCITSDHQPQNIERKQREFEHADYGMITLQTFYPLLNKHVIPQIGVEQFVACVSHNPRLLLNLPEAAIEEGKDAILTVFDANSTWVFDESSNQSLSQNSPELGREMKGKVLAVANKGMIETF